MDFEVFLVYFLLFLLFFFIILLIVVLVVKKDYAKKTGLITMKKMICLSGLDFEKVLYIVELHKDHLLFRHQTYETRLSLDKVKNVALQSESEIVNINKGVIGRSLIGGAMFGGAGAIVGGMTGGNKQSKVYKNFLMISYLKKDELEHIILKLEDSKKPVSKSSVNLELKLFADKIKSRIPRSFEYVTKEL